MVRARQTVRGLWRDEMKCHSCGHPFKEGDTAYEIDLRTIQVKSKKVTINHPVALLCVGCHKKK